MPLLLANWKLIALLGAITATFFAGWHSHTWYDGYNAQKIEIKAVDSLGKGEMAVIDFNSAIDKAKVNAKDDCINRDMPVSFLRLLK